MLLPLLALSTTLPLSVVAHSHSHASNRKTVSFGSAHPHASFKEHAVDPSIQFFKLADSSAEGDRAKLALSTAKAYLKEFGTEGLDWFIREDSYTDKATGVTHVYVRQVVNAVEVVDGDINLNIDAFGQIISSGNSFFAGSRPPLSVGPSETHLSHCAELVHTLKETSSHLAHLLKSVSPTAAAEHLLQYGHDQVTFGAGSDNDAAGHDATSAPAVLDLEELDRVSAGVKELRQTFQGMCPQEIKDSVLSAIHKTAESAAPAVLSFLALVTPDNELSRSIHVSPSSILDKISSTFSHSFLPSSAIPHVTEHIDNVPTLLSPAKATQGYQQDGAGNLVPVWRVEVEMIDNWYEGTVEVGTGRVLSAVDWARDAPSPRRVITSSPSEKETLKPIPVPAPTGEEMPVYNIWAFGVNDPVSGNRTLASSPYDTVASPAGWHSIPVAENPLPSTAKGVYEGKLVTNYTTTAGNNVFAQENWEGQSNWAGNYRPIGELANGSVVYDFEYGAEEGLRPKEYIDLAVLQLFYTCNMFHDLTYRLGFDELSGNFQEYNFEKGGKGGDAVIAMAQDGSGTNNANFMTPPDGQKGRMRMYVWDTATPYRDGDLEAGIVIHEFAHGLSTRLTGGPANSGCLGWGEAGGMGEGWGDALATQIRKTSKYSDFPMGSWAANRATGIRNYPYSLNETVNPSTYKTLDKSGYYGVHAIGEVWAQMLFVVAETLIEKHGFSSTLFPPVNASSSNDYYRNTAVYDAAGNLAKPLVPKHGNTLLVQLMLNGMKLQPCRPTFTTARDAILQADKVLTGGENACDIWSAFASRGLGETAECVSTPWGSCIGGRTEDFAVPKGVCKSK